MLVRQSRHVRAWLGVAVAACAGLLGLAPGAALASTVIISPTTLSYSAGDGEDNAVTLSRTAAGDVLDIEDPGATIFAPGCLTIDVDAHHVQCPAADVRTLTITLEDLDDALTLADSVYPADPKPEEITALGGPGSDTLTGGSGPDDLYGGTGGDIIAGAGGDDFLVGGVFPAFPEAGTDGADSIDGGPGAERFISGGPGDDRIAAGSGDDRLVTGGDGADAIDGGGGDDDLVGGAGDDRVQGGDGNDAVDVGVTLAGGSDDPVFLLGRDTLDGGAGDDRIGVGHPLPLEPDVLGGGDGIDTVSYSARRAPVVVSIDGLANDGEAGEADNVMPDVERVDGGLEGDTIVGGPAADQLDGGPGDDLILGLGGNDRLDGGAGDSGSDSVEGGTGDDALQGGPGDDSLAGGDGDDGGGGGGGSDTVDGNAGRDELAGGAGLDTVTGGDGDDVLRGGDVLLIGADGADDLAGGEGNDTLVAGPGNDRLDGGLGADLIGGEAGRDVVSYERRVEPVTVTFDGLPNDGEPDENDNVASDVESVIGGVVGDTLNGDARGNDLSAGSGEDLVDGAGGQDVLSGGSASDVLRARDGARDDVRCGPGRDLAVLDRGDTARGCEFLDRSGARRPALGRAVLARRTRGRAAFRLPTARRYIGLDEALRLPVGTTIDARTSRVRLTTAREHGRRQTALFSEGVFSVRQRRSGARRRITEIRLRGGNFSACDAAPRGRTLKARQRDVRRVWGKGRGHYRTRGRYSSGAVRGTTWLTADRCDGTLTRVVTGTVVVRDFTLRRTVVLHAGESYLARAPRPSRG